MDWRIPTNQHVKVGYWFAWLPQATAGTIDIGDLRCWVSPTTGLLQRRRELEQIDLSRADDSWPVSLTEPESAFFAAKVRAYQHLVVALKAGR